MPKLCRINLYPVKSFDAQRVDEAVLLPSGGLENDRRWMLVDRAGDPINGKRTPAIHKLRSSYDLANRKLTLRVVGNEESHTFDIDAALRELVEWLGNYFGQPVSLQENSDGGFPDDVESPGPTLISTATLTEVAGWFAGLSVDEARDRFRANLEIDADEPFWEDRLVADGMRAIRFRIGEAELLGSNPCARCPVPTRNPYTGEPLREFARTFARRRQETLPAWAPSSRFDHFYRLAVNTRPVHSRHCTLRVGDEVSVLGPA